MAVRRLAAVLLACCVVLPAGLAAQAQPPSPDGDGDAGGRHGDPARREAWRAEREARMRQLAADLATVLKLRPDQQGAFQAWQDAMAPPEWKGGEGRRHDGQDGTQPTSTPQTLDREQARMAERDARAKARLEATRRFYAVLSPEQQKSFDALMHLHEGEGHGMGGHGRGEGDPGTDGPHGPPPGAG